MIAHLWTASWTALAAAILVLLLRRVPARVRFTLLLVATLRFAVPTPLLTSAGAALASCLPSRPVILAQAQALEGLIRPGGIFVSSVSAHPIGLPLDRAVPVLWLLGVSISLAVWFRRGATRVVAVREASEEEIAALKRAAARLRVPTPPLKIAEPGFTPSAAGIWRPEVILPDGLAEELSAGELESVCAHELAHIRRRDNLTAAVTRAIAAAFWFHPLVWWMSRRMLAERELACDEMVVATGESEAYASALSKVCLAVPGTHGFAAMAGPNLTERLERIMTNKSPMNGRAFRVIPAAIALCALLIPIGAGFVRAQGPASRAGDSLAQAAEACYKQKDYAQAETLYRRMMAEFPADPRGVVGLAETYEALKRPADAIRVMRDAAEANLSSFEYRLALGNLHVRAEEYTDALAEHDGALKLAGSITQTAKVYSSMGETYRRMGRMDEAIAALRKAKDLEGKPSLQLALILDGTGQSNLAEQEYEAMLRDNPQDPVALNNLAYRLAERGEQLNEAFDYALRAQQAIPASPDVTDTVGWIYMKKRLPDQAAAEFTNALLQADNPMYRQHMAAALDLKGDWTPSRRELRTLLDTATTEAQVQRMKQLLAAK